MGVPKFFRFISERYPCLSEVVKEYEIPEFDNFYIDANGIIHNCSHPDDSVHFRITYEEIFKDIFFYLEALFRLIQPKKLFFIAIDGVAPRAKMNQQRSRRFRTAKEAELAEKKARDNGEVLPDTERFDSNCITPGTEFMDRLHKQLQYFIKYKISTDELWQRPKIILSGHNVPGEGEHKIMDFIRYLRSQEDWDPNTRHCLHGLDADLVMLGLCTHEPHFSLLREEVKFSRNAKKPKNVEETTFYLLHLSMMRGYLDLEFQSLKDKLPFGYDIERIVDDWVLMGFLVGNDFIPNLPKFDIANNALHKLYQAYIEILPTLGGYINDYGTLNLERFEKYLRKVSEIEMENFREIQADIKYLESKSGMKYSDELDEAETQFDDELLMLVEDTNKLLEIDFDNGAPFDSCDEEELFQEEFRDYKARFYMEKLNYENVDREVLKSQAECYVRAIQWNLFYYYRGCPSWSWYYPHHYAPYVSDIKDFSDFELKFDLSTPFLPFQQLLAVLPAASKNIVPKAFQNLMDSPDSPIIEFYPTNFETDLNDKKNDWEAVVLIPFIDETSLLDAMKPHYDKLTDEENLRNSVQPMEVYLYTSESLGVSKAPEYFPDIEENHAQVTVLWRSDVAVEPQKLVKGILPGALEGARYGFPQLRGIEFTARLEPAKVKVFEFPSRGENMILSIPRLNIESKEELLSLAEKLSKKVVYVGWPLIQKGKVTGISTENFQLKIVDHKPVIKNADSKNQQIATELRRRHMLNLGIDLDKVDVVLYVKTVEDIRVKFVENSSDMEGQLNYVWSESSEPFPYQTCLDQSTVNIIDNDEELEEVLELEKVLSAGKQVFLLDINHYGSLGKVKSIKNGTIVEVTINVDPEPDLSGILDLSLKTELKYYPGSIAAQRLGIGTLLFSRLTGSIFLYNKDREEKFNVGLGLKFTKQGVELVGFTRREGNTWLYSEKTISLLNDYMAKFPELFEHLPMRNENDIFTDKDIFPENTEEKISEIKAWLKAQCHTKAERRPFGSQLLTPEALKEIEKRVLENSRNIAGETKDVDVMPSEIYIPKSRIGKAPPDPAATVNLLDRIVSVRKSHCIPLGLRGTVVGIDKPVKNADSLYDILFDSPVIGGTNRSCDQARIYKLPYQSFINISHRKRKWEKVNGSPGAKMTHQANIGESWRSPHVSNDAYSRGESKPYQWNKTREINQPNVQESDSVKQFIQSLNNMKGPHPANQVSNERPVKANMEFHAMWNFLQTQKVPDEKSLRPGIPKMEPISPVETAVHEQTNALRKLLKINNSPVSSVNQHLGPDYQTQFMQQPNSSWRGGNIPQLSAKNLMFHPGNVRPKTCSHVNCYSELRNLCTNKGIQHPLFDYKPLASSGEVTCIITFLNDLGKVVGDSCRSKDEAAENASCKAIRQILKREEMMRSPIGGFRNQQPQSQPSLRPNQQPASRMGMDQQLPIPPMQWCSSRRSNDMQYSPSSMKKPSSRNMQEQGRISSNMLNSPMMNSQREDFRGAALDFSRKEEALSTEGDKSQQKSSTTSNQILRRQAGRGKSRIAAKFSVPLDEKK